MAYVQFHYHTNILPSSVPAGNFSWNWALFSELTRYVAADHPDIALLTSLLDETVHIMDFYIRIFNTITNVLFSHKKGLQKTLPIASFGREKATLCR